MFATDSSSERATSIEDYQNTCTEFITDISHDYMDWIERYQLGEEETARRKATINHIVKTTNDWIVKYGTTIKKVDIVMNDGINKMAEFTAGYPFKLEVLLDRSTRYALHEVGKLKVNVKATPTSGSLARLGNYYKDQLFLLSSTCRVNYIVSEDSMKGVDALDDYVIFDATQCQKKDLISFTITVEQVSNSVVSERRGYSTIVMLT